MESVLLKSGQRMPVLGLGTWMLSGKDCRQAVSKAISLGYRHIDTADWYRNHERVGEAIKDFDRSELFLTTKVWRSDLSYDGVISKCSQFLKELSTDYIDLLLVHWPNDRIPIGETMKSMKKLVDEGKVRSVGLSNFDEGGLKEAIGESEVPISVNQVEFHPHLYQQGLLSFCKSKGIAVTAYCPLGRGSVLSDPVIKDIAESRGRSPAQVSLRWIVQHGAAAIPKSASEAHIRDNMDIFGWKLSEGEMERIDGIGACERIVNPAFPGSPVFSKVPRCLIRRVPKRLKKLKKGRFFG